MVSAHRTQHAALAPCCLRVAQLLPQLLQLLLLMMRGYDADPVGNILQAALRDAQRHLFSTEPSRKSIRFTCPP